MGIFTGFFRTGFLHWVSSRGCHILDFFGGSAVLYWISLGAPQSLSLDSMPFHHSGGSLCNGANKLYILRTQLKTGKVIEIAKAKGMTKYDKNGHPLFAWNDYEAMHHPTDPKPLTCTQTQFKLGMSGYCRDGDGIKPITIHKIPKDAHARYDKGNLQSDGRIVPWLI